MKPPNDLRYQQGGLAGLTDIMARFLAIRAMVLGVVPRPVHSLLGSLTDIQSKHNP